ncbi:Exocyst complex component Sec3 [Aspergillus sp. HF37]|nr:Exocyst complex component Sec3 [Aspergillus sp. HF37]
MAPELKSKEFPNDVPAVPPLNPMEKPYGHSEESLTTAQPDHRPPLSRDGQGAPELRPKLGPQDSVPDSPETKHSKDGVRPTTAGSVSGESRNFGQSPASSLGHKYPANESSDKISTPEVLAQSRDNAAVNGSVVGQRADVPPSTEALETPPTAETVGTAAPRPSQEVGRGEPATEAAMVTSPTSPSELSEPTEDDPDAHRPGLGPMVKKKQGQEVVGAFRKAANAYGAFRPRPGGAGERLMAAAKKQDAVPEGPDGITSVVPAPSLLRTGTDPATPETPDKEIAPPVASPVKETPTVEVTQAAVEEATVAAAEPEEQPRDSSRAAVKVDSEERTRSVSPSPQGGRRKRREDNTIKYCQALGIEPRVLDGRGVNFDDILTDLGWSGRLGDDKRIEDLEADVRREIGRVEATSWLGNLEQQEGKVDQLARLLDKTIEECDELDGLLTLYAHELNTLHDDVSFIEAQSQGLQVQTANQKLLQSELQNLLKTLSISSTDLRPLKEASLSNPDKLRETERALSVLYKALVMVDADIWQNKKRLVDAAGEHSGVGVYADTEIGQMRAIKEKKEEYRTESRVFLQRLGQFMSTGFKVAEQKRVDAAVNSQRDAMKLDNAAYGYFRQELWMYNALMLFAREVSRTEWQGIITLYEKQAKPPYQAEFRDNNHAWKKAARKATGEEQGLLFTHQDKEKESEGITMAARKLTVKRGKTIRAAAGLRLSTGDKQHGKIEPYEAFSGTLRETLKMMSEEQNFVVQFFHLNSLVNADFPDLVASAKPDERRCPDFSAKQSHDPDRGMAKKVEQTMDELFSFWPIDMQGIVNWAINADHLQGVGILLALEMAMADFDDTNQEFIIHSLQKLHAWLVGQFNRFVDEQIRGIEETKVKVNKRRGVISFMRVFPSFSSAVENMLSQPSHEFSDIRVNVNEAYERINRAMWESLKFIAKEAPGHPQGVAAGVGDPEDKEALNYHILLIENMNHYIEEVDVRDLPVLERWRRRAGEDLEEHMKLYLDAVIRRPLGRLLEFVESAEGLLAAGHSPGDIANRANYSRSVAKKLLAAHDGREIRRGIDLLKKRAEKHFGDADDPGLSRSLVLKVLRECEGRYGEAYDRMRRIVDTMYEGSLELDWCKEDVGAMFKR